jgi:hydroxyacylglutathione hydrolase
VKLVHCIVSGRWRQNGYLLEHEDGSALLIDPGGEADAFRRLIANAELAPCAILNTHAHYDHLGAVVDLIEAYAVPFYLNGADRALLRQANLYKSLFGETTNIRVPQTFSDLAPLGDRLTIGNFDVEIIATPGHTKGSTCFRVADSLFSGDTLLPNGSGRVDLPGGSPRDMDSSITRLSRLPGELAMYPGHGASVPLAQAVVRAHAKRNTA